MMINFIRLVLLYGISQESRTAFIKKISLCPAHLSSQAYNQKVYMPSDEYLCAADMQTHCDVEPWIQICPPKITGLLMIYDI